MYKRSSVIVLPPGFPALHEPGAAFRGEAPLTSLRNRHVKMTTRLPFQFNGSRVNIELQLDAQYVPGGGGGGEPGGGGGGVVA